jgi:uridine kinase
VEPGVSASTVPRATLSDAPPADGPRAQADLDLTDLRDELRALRSSKLFWVGVAAKVVGALLFGSHFATRWFAPFVYGFVHGKFADPWQPFLERGDTLAFPYGPGMLGLLSLSWLPALVTSFDPSSHLGLFLLRVPLFCADVAVLLFLMRWLRVHAHDAVVAYWLSPVVFYATYVHGQLDLLPTALLCTSLYLLFKQRLVPAAVVFGLSLATKGHLLIAFPFVVVFLHRQRKSVAKFALVTLLVAGLLYAFPLTSPAFRTMVLGSAESKKLWSVVIPYGGVSLYVAPGAIGVALLRFAGYRKVNRELLLMFLGALYVALVALVPPQPGWFVWSMPFVAYFGARLSRTGKVALTLLSGAYLAYFFVSDAPTFLEAFDPVFGQGRGLVMAERLTQAFPRTFSPHGASVTFTALFATIVICGVEMYRKGLRSNGIYAFRDQSFMLGLGGDSGAGKHTIGRDLARLFPDTMTLINGDDDHRWERGHAMWSEYTHLDPRGNLLRAQLHGLESLRRGSDVRKRHYDHDKGKFTDPLLLRAKDFVSIVGLHPFYLPSQRHLLHLKVFVAPEETTRREWKIARDMKKRGYTREQVIEQIDRREADSIKYIRPQKRFADLVVRLLASPESETDLYVEYELSSLLDPLTLFEVLVEVEGLTVEWNPDADLDRDTLRIRGNLDAEQLKVIARVAVPNLDELVDDRLDGILPGSRGLTQLVLLHAMSVRLRQGSAVVS